MKKQYKEPIISVINVDTDIIATSNPEKFQSSNSDYEFDGASVGGGTNYFD